MLGAKAARSPAVHAGPPQPAVNTQRALLVTDAQQVVLLTNCDHNSGLASLSYSARAADKNAMPEPTATAPPSTREDERKDAILRVQPATRKVTDTQANPAALLGLLLAGGISYLGFRFWKKLKAGDTPESEATARSSGQVCCWLCNAGAGGPPTLSLAVLASCRPSWRAVWAHPTRPPRLPRHPKTKEVAAHSRSTSSQPPWPAAAAAPGNPDPGKSTRKVVGYTPHRLMWPHAMPGLQTPRCTISGARVGQLAVWGHGAGAGRGDGSCGCCLLPAQSPRALLPPAVCCCTLPYGHMPWKQIRFPSWPKILSNYN